MWNALGDWKPQLYVNVSRWAINHTKNIQNAFELDVDEHSTRIRRWSILATTTTATTLTSVTKKNKHLLYNFISAGV